MTAKALPSCDGKSVHAAGSPLYVVAIPLGNQELLFLDFEILFQVSSHP
jgi:hypothetical protein